MAANDFDARAFMDAWNAKDYDRVLQFVADDIEYQDPFLKEPVRGKDAYRDAIKRHLDAFSDLRSKRVAFDVTEGNDMAVLNEESGVFDGDLRLPDGTVHRGTGNRFDEVFADFMTINDAGKIQRKTIVFDTADLFRQLGVEAPVPAQR